MSDGKVRIDTAIETKGLDKGLKSVKGKLTDLTKNFAKAGVAGVATAVSVKAIASGIKDVTEAYKGQIKSEKMLESASKNNPYLDSRSVQQLKEYADNVQSLTGHDNVLVQEYMTMLAGAGRTQEQIQEIVTASADLASAGLMDMGTAVKELSKSYEGQGRTLGMLIPAVKGLTEEEMKQGRAVDVVKKAYGGLAEETFSATGATVKLANAWGDAKKELGAPIEKALAPARLLFAELIDGWTESARARREYNEAVEKEKAGTAEVSDYEKLIAGQIEKVEILQKALDKINKETYSYSVSGHNIKVGKKNYEKMEENLEKEKERLEVLKEELAVQEEIEDNINKQIQEAEELAKAKAKQQERDDKAQKHIDSVTKARKEQLEIMRLSAKTRGEEIDEQEVLNVYMNSYVDLVAKSEGLVSENNRASKELLKTIEAQSKVVNKKLSAEELELKMKEKIAEFEAMALEIQQELSEADYLRKQLNELKKYHDEVQSLENVTDDEKLRIYEEYTRARIELEKQLTKAEVAEQKERISEYINAVSEFASEYNTAMNNITRLAREGAEARALLASQEVKRQYNDGAISYDEYQSRLEKIDKDMAKKKYKIAMWEWGAQLADASVSVATGIAKALGNGPFGIAMAALIGAAGAAQIALIAGNKPPMPAFAGGGIVGGNSYNGDHIVGRLNSGELIANRYQQKQLWDMINNPTKSGMNVQIHNYASNDVTAKPVVTERGIQLFIRKTVAKDMADGKYNQSYRQMQGGMGGVRLTN